MALDDVPDHYATLEVEPDCSIEDINKAYKRLAMKNHPDRNRGHEQEAVARFQAVQAAHEVLKEQETRRRYDLSRRLPTANGSTYARQPAARGNPYKASSNFPPPPMRTNPTRQPQNTANRGAHRGAEGFTHFPPPPPPRPQPKTSTNKDAKDRANMFEAWQSMHGSKSPERKAAPTATPRGNTPHGYPAYGSNLDPRSGPQRAKSDDAQQKSAFEGSKWQKNFVNVDTNQGPPKRGGFDPATPSGDERPASVSGYSQSHVRSDRDNAAGYTQRGPAPTAKRPETSSYFDPPSSGNSRRGTPNNANTGERTRAAAEDVKRTASTADTANTHQIPERGPFGRARPRQPEAASKYYSSSDSDDIESTAASARSTTTPPHVNMQSRPKAMPRSRRSGTTTPLSNPPTSAFDGAKDGSNIFTFPVQADTFDRTFGPLPEKINTNFTGSTRHIPAFGSPPPPPPQPASHSDAFTFPYSSGPPPQSGLSSTYGTPLESPQPSTAKSTGTAHQANTGTSTWSSAQWSQTLQTDNWASQWANAPPQGFTTSQSPTRRSKSVKGGSMRNKPRPDNIEDEEAGPAPEWTDTDSNAMDVDTTVPADAGRPQQQTRPASPLKAQAEATPTQPRTVYVEPTKADWATQPSNEHTPGPTSTPLNMNGNSYSPPHSRRASRANASASQPTTAPTLSMNDFRNVAPFTTNDSNTSTTTPLNSLEDMSTSLPFESQASKTHPTTSHAPPLELPKLPRPPTVPAKLTDEAELSTYLRSFSAYLSAWSHFKNQMLALMSAQAIQAEAMERNTAGDSAADAAGKEITIMRDWLIARGETERARGWESYARGVKQAERAAEYWGVAVGRHGDAVGAFERVRERLRGAR